MPFLSDAILLSGFEPLHIENRRIGSANFDDDFCDPDQAQPEVRESAVRMRAAFLRRA